MEVLATPHVLSSERAVLGESPRWDDRTGTVLWVDIDRGTVWSASLGGGPAAVAHRTAAPLGALVLHDDGGLLWAVGDGWARPGDAGPRLSLGLPEVRFNDAGVDAAGAVWSGTMRRDETMPEPGHGVLYRLEQDGAVPLEDGLVVSNGIAWSPDDGWVHLVDSGPGTVRRARSEAGTGPVGGWETWLTITSGMPDGIATDAEGGVWVACWGTGEVRRFDERGEPTHVLRLPTPAVTAVAFAGPQLDVLVCTTSSQGVPVDDDPLAGQVFVAQAPVPGVPLHRAVVPC